MSYRDMIFCPYYKDCKQGDSCGRALTDEVLKGADRWWGGPGAPICQFSCTPDCFEEKEPA